MIEHEPANWTYHVFCALGIMLLVGFYFFGVWLRSHVLPSNNQLSAVKQLLIAVPVGLITMSIYAKSAFTAMKSSPDTITFDVTLSLGYAIILGMLSRETLDRIFKGHAQILFENIDLSGDAAKKARTKQKIK